MKINHDDKTMELDVSNGQPGRPPKNGLRPMTAAERQKEYRERRKASALEFNAIVSGFGENLPRVMLLDVLSFQLQKLDEEGQDSEFSSEYRTTAATVINELVTRYGLQDSMKISREMKEASKKKAARRKAK